MPIIELYSTRNENKYPDTYQYEWVTEKLRVQLSKIIGDGIGRNKTRYIMSSPVYTCSHILFKEIYDLLSKEYGEESLNGFNEGSYEWAKQLILTEPSIDRFLDAIEVFSSMILERVKPNLKKFKEELGGVKQLPEKAISEINERMKRDGFGYQYIDGIIIKVDQEFVHSEVTKPALFLLSSFEGARHEFLNAHEHYRHGRYSESLNDCNKAVESLLKNICENENWEYSKGTINALVPVCLEKGLIPKYLQTQLSSLGNLLTQGISSIRNNESGHGQGTNIKELPEHIVSYALHLTATNILFISNCYDQYSI